MKVLSHPWISRGCTPYARMGGGGTRPTGYTVRAEIWPPKWPSFRGLHAIAEQQIGPFPSLGTP